MSRGKKLLDLSEFLSQLFHLLLRLFELLMSYGKSRRDRLQFPFQLDRMRVRSGRRWERRDRNRVGRLSAQGSLHRNQNQTSEKFATNVSHSSAFSVCRSVRR